MKYKTKQTLKTVLASVLALVVVGGAIGLTASLINKNDDGMKEIHPSFEVGGLTSTGKYEETKYSIYTKDSFECQGLKVELAFDSNVEYSAFFYDTNGNHLNSYTELGEVYSEGHTFEVPAEAMYARLEVTPIWDSDVEEEDKELGFFDISKYANQLTIKVNENQKVETFADIEQETLGFKMDPQKNLFSSDGIGKLGASGSFEDDGTSPWAYDHIDTAGYLYVIARIPAATYSGTVLRNGTEQPACTIYKYVSTANTKYTTATQSIIAEIDPYVYVKIEVETLNGLGLTIDKTVINDVLICGF